MSSAEQHRLLDPDEPLHVLGELRLHPLVLGESFGRLLGCALGLLAAAQALHGLALVCGAPGALAPHG
ncbi:MAG: hypothetical protein HKN44_13785, partial [Ilumatobacter sp.]|nr:hypothetical protein [Ilumatobacter sp.]